MNPLRPRRPHRLLPPLLLTIAFCGLALAPRPAMPQGTQLDYQRAGSLASRTARALASRNVSARWLPGGTAFWYRVEKSSGRHEFVFVDAIRGARRAAFDHARLAQVLGAALQKPIEADALPFSWIRLAPDASWVRFRAGDSGDRVWQFENNALRVSTEPLAEETLRPIEPRPSWRTGEATAIQFENRAGQELSLFWIDAQGEHKPYGTIAPHQSLRRTTFAGHVWLVLDAQQKPLGALEAGEDEALVVLEPQAATDGAADAKPRSAPRQPPEPTVEKKAPAPAAPRFRAFIRDHNLWRRDAQGLEAALSSDGSAANAFEEPFWISPNGKYLVAQQVKPAQERKLTLVESSPRDGLQPRVRIVDYPKPGDRVRIERPRLFDLEAGREIPTSDALFHNPYEISGHNWSADGAAFRFLFNQRGHQILRVVEIQAATGQARVLAEEKSATFVDYSQKTFARWLDKTSELIWTSERDGWNHLYLFDTRSGQLKSAITRGQWVMREVVRVDEAKRQVWFRALGIVPGQDPYHSHLARVNFDGSGLQVLTSGDGNHSWRFSPDERFFIDTFSRVDLALQSELSDARSGRLICALEQADIGPLLQAGWTMPERFEAPARDGKTPIHGIMVRPSNFDARQKYPVIEQIYAGPQDFFVPKSFGLLGPMHELAELGFIVVQIDGMGTNWRSRAFHDVAWKNLRDARLPDRIAWMKAAARTRPWMDLGRVGIYGGSAGGQNALGALLFHSDFYKAAVADCGCHDNRMDKLWWNEAWMGWPVDKSYEDSSNVVHAGNLRGALQLVVGELDTNVDPASTMQVADALVRADKDFELLVIPGAGHGAGGGAYGTRRRYDFFVRHLLGVEPRAK